MMREEKEQEERGLEKFLLNHPFLQQHTIVFNWFPFLYKVIFAMKIHFSKVLPKQQQQIFYYYCLCNKQTTITRRIVQTQTIVVIIFPLSTKSFLQRKFTSQRSNKIYNKMILYITILFKKTDIVIVGQVIYLCFPPSTKSFLQRKFTSRRYIQTNNNYNKKNLRSSTLKQTVIYFDYLFSLYKVIFAMKIHFSEVQ